MESAVIRHTDSLLARLVSLLMVCHARRLEWVKSIDSTVSVHLALRLLSSLAKRSVAADTLSVLDVACVCAHSRSSHWLTQHGMWLALQPLRIFTLVDQARDVVGSATTRNLHTGRPSTGCGWLCNPSESSHWSIKHGMWLALQPLGIFTLVYPARDVVGSATLQNLHTGRPSTECGWLCNPSECAFW